MEGGGGGREGESEGEGRARARARGGERARGGGGDVLMPATTWTPRSCTAHLPRIATPRRFRFRPRTRRLTPQVVHALVPERRSGVSLTHWTTVCR
jgi:hypothetical protein